MRAEWEPDQLIDAWTLLAEICKLSTVRGLGLDGAVFGGASDRIVAAWRARAARIYPSDIADCPDPAVRYTLPAALCWSRQAELVDGLVELLTGLIHRINVRAERRVKKELIGALVNVPGKRGIFTRLVDGVLEHPDDTVREAVYPVVPGGEKTLSALARELKATDQAVAERVRYQLRGSYSHYYRRMLASLLAALEFCCNNSAYRPAMDAVDLLARYAGTDSDQKFYVPREKVPVDGIVPKAWLDGVVDDGGRVERIPYELCLLIALRDALRRREVYVQGAGRWKDPDEDLPGDFEDNRDVHYAALAKPLDATELIGSLQRRLEEGLNRLDTGLQVVENWNSANDKIYYGRESVLAGADREHFEVSMLALHLLQSSLVFISTQLLQAVLRDPAWAGKLTDEDRRGLSPLFWLHVNPYGRFRLDMDTRLDLTAA